jgi:cytochrome c-type biogenesis protein
MVDYLLAALTALVTFISPCVLPLLPVYVTYFAADEASRRKTFFNALAFCAGISVFFIALFTTAALLGHALSVFIFNNSTVIFIVCGAILVLFGLKFMGLIKLPFMDGTVNIKAKTQGMNILSAFILGLVFSFSMGSCVLAVGSFSLIAAIVGANFLHGFIIGLFFTLTLCMLFLVCAMFIDLLKGFFTFIKRHYRIINTASGILLIVLGILVALGITQNFQTLRKLIELLGRESTLAVLFGLIGR